MAVHDLWAGLSKEEIAKRRKMNRPRWQRRWREGVGRDAPQRKQSYKEHQQAQAYLDDASHMQNPKALRIRRDSLSVSTLLDRHLAAKADRAPRTVEANAYHASIVRIEFGHRPVMTLDTTEVETWTQRVDVARGSRKKQLEILRAAIKRGVRDGLVENDVTDGLIVPLGHKERPHWSSTELTAVLDAARDDYDRALLGVLGLMGTRSGEVRGLDVGDYRDKRITVTNSGSRADATKTRAGRRVLPAPESVQPWLDELVGRRHKSAPLFESSRRPGEPVGKRYLFDALTRALTNANRERDEKDKIKRINVHGLRHTYAAIALGEAGIDIFALSKALGHAKPSITLNEYGHLAPAGLEVLAAKIDAIVSPLLAEGKTTDV